MKHLPIILLLSTLRFASFAQENDTAIWLTQIEEAKILATEQNVPILMVFSGSDWCKPCIQMRMEIWKSEAFLHYAKDSLVLLRLDFPARKKNRLSPEQTTHNEALAEQYNPSGDFPKAVLIDQAGKELARFGYESGESPEDYIAFLQEHIHHAH